MGRADKILIHVEGFTIAGHSILDNLPALEQIAKEIAKFLVTCECGWGTKTRINPKYRSTNYEFAYVLDQMERGDLLRN